MSCYRNKLYFCFIFKLKNFYMLLRMFPADYNKVIYRQRKEDYSQRLQTILSDADRLLQKCIGNFVPAISLEGFKEATDGRRGDGVYQKVHHALELLRSKKLVYGISSCYTSANYESITSEEYLDKLIGLGAWFIWYFHYMPVGNDAVPELMPTPAQRRGTYERIRRYRAEKPLFAMDFQNDAEYVGGYIAGGRRYLHINANGDIDPCVFIHYSDSNIREKTLLEALRSPIMMAYHK